MPEKVESLEQAAKEFLAGYADQDLQGVNDKRADRTLTVVRLLDDGKVLCTIGATGKQTRIRRDRFRPTASGYRLLRDNGRKASEVPHE